MITGQIYKTWAIVATGAAVVAALIALGFGIAWHLRGAQIDAQSARVETLTLVANSNAGTTKMLSEQLAVCKDQLGPIVQANEQAVSQLNREALTLVQRLRNMEQERRKLYESEACAVLTRVPVCPDVATRLRALEAGDTD